MKSKAIYLLMAAALLLPLASSAQVDKQVEVTRDYVPDVAPARKLPVEPDMTDTVRMRPDIDYSITPLSWQTNLATEKFRPATVTYWNFNRPQPFYLKAGAGYPLHSVGDLYLSTQNPDVGYAMLYANHRGDYADIENYFGLKPDSRRMLNRIGVAAGSYVRKHLAEIDLSYDNRLHHRYSGPGGSPWLGERINTGVFSGEIRFGDDFKDLSRVNFDIAARGSIFSDNTPYIGDPDYAQFDYGVSAAVGRRFGRHTLRLDVDYDAWTGDKDMDFYRNDIVHAGVRYGRSGGFIDYTVGADYYYDKHRGRSADHYVTPFLHLRFNVSRRGHFVPFIEIGGSLDNNSYMSLTRINPYVIPGMSPGRNSLHYDFRFGVAGNAASNRIAYRLLVGLSFVNHDLFWYVRDYMFFGVETARRNALSFDAEFTWRPVGNLAFVLAASGWSYSDEVALNSGRPAFESHVKAEYSVRRWKFSAAADMRGKTRWTNKIGSDRADWLTFSAPFTADLSVGVEWRCRSGVGLFLEGRNLADSRIYPFAYCPEYGIGFTFGVKVQF